jgi:replicative DNA helicase
MKQTAVEFLVSEMNKLKMHVDDSEHDKVLDIIEQAKEMERKQIIEAHLCMDIDGYFYQDREDGEIY